MTSCHIPASDCHYCQRLADFRQNLQADDACKGWHNAPVDSAGSINARLLIIGMAPGLKSGNRTGIPFIGDRSGDLLYPCLIQAGFALGQYESHADTGPALHDCRISNILRCVPPQNRPTAAEIKNCRPFLLSEIGAMPHLQHILVLGGLAHNALLDCFDLRKKDHPFAHGAHYTLPNGIHLTSSYHCSQYNVNTRLLTPVMFSRILEDVKSSLK